MALSLVLALTLVLALVRNIIIFSKVRALVLNQPIMSAVGKEYVRFSCHVDQPEVHVAQHHIDTMRSVQSQ